MTITYNGGGYFAGIPARDLTQEEWDALTGEQQKMALDSGLYTPNGSAKEKKAIVTAATDKAKAEAPAPAAQAAGSKK